MSYSRQFSDLVNDRRLDFSRSDTLLPIAESQLPRFENGLGSYDPTNEQHIVFATPSGLGYWLTGSNTEVPWGPQSSFAVDNIESIGCVDSTISTLTTFKDWNPPRLSLTARTSSTWWD